MRPMTDCVTSGLYIKTHISLHLNPKIQRVTLLKMALSLMTNKGMQMMQKLQPLAFLVLKNTDKQVTR